jgi:signal transduction histidine kinase
MSFEPRSRFARAFGLRIALWYAVLFVAGALAIMWLTYTLTSASLERRDQQIIQAKIGEYATIYQRDGLDSLISTVRTEQLTAPERLFVRVVTRSSEAVIATQVDEPDTLEIASLRLPDGGLIQVGKSTAARRDILARFRSVLGIAILSIIAIALTGGILVTQTAVAPIRTLIDAVQRITQTGRTDARVPVAGTGDAIDELTTLFNSMLDRIERLVAAMRGSLDNVSHDLRTPMTRLRAVAESALAGEPDAERYREALSDCIEEADRVLVMLNALMDISEAEGGTLPLHRERTAIDEIVGHAVELYRDVADAKEITLTARVDPQAVASVDATRLQQVVANLLDNAIKYTPAGGRVEIEGDLRPGRGAATGAGAGVPGAAAGASGTNGGAGLGGGLGSGAGAAAGAGSVVLRVRDTGVGIPADELPRIWDRLFRGDRSRAERGLGLGLSLVKAIVEAHGGQVAAESAPGRGALFTVTLPVDSPDSALRGGPRLPRAPAAPA